MSLKQLVRLLWNNKVVILLIPILVAIAVYFLTFNLSRQYESKAVVFTNPNSNRGETFGGMERVDFYTSNNLFDNLMLLMKSRETLNDASLKLLALHLSIERPVSSVITQKSFNELQEHFSPALKQELGVNGNPGKTYDNLVAFHQAYPDSVVDYLLREHPHYGFQDILDHLFVARKSSSDMMEISLKSDDPAVCYHSLKYIIESFMERYEELKEQENINSIHYFEEQLRLSHSRLTASELDLKEFISANQILNYYEQGKYLYVAQLEQDQDEERAQRLASGTRANLDQIESIFSGFEERQDTMDFIDSLQSQLTLKQMELEGINIGSPNNSGAKRSLSEDIQTLQIQLEKTTESLVNSSLSAQGIPRKNILDEWLRLKIQYEEQIQAIEVMKRRKEVINEKINEFAPLGAELNRLEREVKVNENQYLTLLNGLNLAQLRKYDLETTSSQKLIDEPIFPKKPLPSKRKILVAGGLLGSGFMVVSVLILFSFLDSTVRSAQNAHALTKLQVAGGWLKQPKSTRNELQPLLYKRLIKQFYNQVAVYLNRDASQISIVFYSIERGEGKTFLANKFIEELLSQGRTVTFVLAEDSVQAKVPGCQYLSYDAMDADYWKQLPTKATGEIVIFEHPNIQLSNINFGLMNQAHLNVLVMDATRIWSSADQAFFDNVQKGLTKPQVIWLNKMNEEDLEDINGEIPKKRNKARVFIKKLLT